MERVEVEAFSQATNTWIIRTPGRQFPAAVIQGDSLSQLFALAQSILERTRACGCDDEELAAEAEELRDQLWGRLEQYETTLHAAGLPLPYNRIAWPK
jgi:putative ribosome biogenesis GTPase RsgA